MAKEMNYEALNANLKMLDKKGEMAFEQARANGTLTPEQEKFSALMSDEAFLEKFLAADSAEEVKAIFSENGLDLSIDAINALGKSLAEVSKKLIENGGELSEEELEQIAGGACTAEDFGAVAGAIAAGLAGIKVGVEFGGFIGSLICPGFGTGVGAIIGGTAGGFGAAMGGSELGVYVSKGLKKVGSWIKSWF